MNSTRKILPWTMWLSSEEHTFAKEVTYVAVSTQHFNEHASHLYMHVYIIHGELSICLDIKVGGFSMYIQYGDCELVYICDIDIGQQVF